MGIEPALRALHAWSWPSQVRVVEAPDGLINQTFVVLSPTGPIAVIQQLNTKIFVPEVHEDIHAVTLCLSQAGIPTPQLIPTQRDELWHTDELGGVWRCLTYQGDRTVHKLTDPALARSAANLVARFHCAVASLRWEFRSIRPGAHDTAAHMARLSAALDVHSHHRLFDRVAPVAEEALERWVQWNGERGLNARVVHGDLKISNVRFCGDQAHCLIDLDTIARETLDTEMGDAMRSWCNPASEDVTDARFDLTLFAAAMEGYAQGCGDAGPSDQEWDAIPAGIERICLELTARFARDALEESYFGWNRAYGTRGEHNLVRAIGQLGLARDVLSARQEALRIVDVARRR